MSSFTESFRELAARLARSVHIQQVRGAVLYCAEQAARVAGTTSEAMQAARQTVLGCKRKYLKMLDPDERCLYDMQTTGVEEVLGSGSIPNEELDEKVEHEPLLAVGCRFCSLGFPDEEKKQNHSGNVEYSLRVLERSEETPQKPGETDQEHMARCAEDVLQAELSTAPVDVPDATCELGVHLAMPVNGVAEQPPPGDQRSVQEMRRLIHLLYEEDIGKLKHAELKELIAFEKELRELYEARGKGNGLIQGELPCARLCLKIFRDRRRGWLKPTTTLFSVD